MVKAVPTGRGRTTRSFASPWQPGGQSDSAAAERGLDLLGPPVAEDEEAELTEVAAYAPQLIAYEALVPTPGQAPPGEQTSLRVEHRAAPRGSEDIDT
jgi:hypothetical protein